MFSVQTLSNKLRLLTAPMDSVQSITVLVLAAAGSRWEKKENNGISHFLEHMFFKGTFKRPAARDIAGVIDGIGAEFNAFTGKEYTGFFVKCAGKYLELALEVLSDMLLNSKFEEKEIEKEKKVIIEEINLYEDTPTRRIGDVYESLLYGDQPLGWRVLGEKEVIRSLKRDDFLSYINRLYHANNMVLGIAGEKKAVLDKHLPSLVYNYFGKFSFAGLSSFPKVSENQKQPNLRIHFKKTDQAHICLGVRAYPLEHADRYSLAVLSTILGGNMSSRLFLEVREKRGLAYYIHSGIDPYQDTGHFVTQAGCDILRLEDAVKVILEEYRKAGNSRHGSGIGEEELKKAKEFLKGRLILELEDSKTVVSSFVSQALLEKKIKTFPEIIKLIDKVTRDDILKVAKDIFVGRKLNLAVIGPYKNGGKLSRILRL